MIIIGLDSIFIFARVNRDQIQKSSDLKYVSEQIPPPHHEAGPVFSS
jgi:hypothetical protein